MSDKVACPRCGAQVSDLVKVEAGLRLRIQEVGIEGNPFSEVCNNCFNEYRNTVSQGAKLRAEVNAREHNKSIMWKNRIQMLKNGKQRMDLKAYSEAAVFYERYLKAVEVAMDIEPGKIHPDYFKQPGKGKEITVIASVLWDLMRVYDGNSRFKDRLNATRVKLLSFLPYTAAAKDIIKRARRFESQANEPQVFKQFIREGSKVINKGGCFIATASFDTPHAWQVQRFYRFRDEVLLSSQWGRVFVSIYYRLSPPLARWIENKKFFRSISRAILSLIALLLKK